MRVFITGVFGMLGASIALMLKDRHQVWGCDIVEGFILPNVDATRIDLTDFSATNNYLQLIRPDVVIHTAALINVDECERNPTLAYRVNFETTANLSRLGRELGFRLVYISTDSVFDGTKAGAYTEIDPCRPANVYGESKFLGEQAVLQESQKNLVLRTTIYGWNLQQKTGFAEWIYNTLSQGNNITMFHDVVFTPIYVGDFSAILAILLEKECSGVFHLSSSEGVSKFRFGQMLAEVFTFDVELVTPISVDDFSFLAKRSKNMCLSNEKLCKETNTRPLSIKEGLSAFKGAMSHGLYAHL